MNTIERLSRNLAQSRTRRSTLGIVLASALGLAGAKGASADVATCPNGKDESCPGGCVCAPDKTCGHCRRGYFYNEARSGFRQPCVCKDKQAGCRNGDFDTLAPCFD